MLDRTNVPIALASRFLPHEALIFEVLREEGALRLWRSTARRSAFRGEQRKSVPFHITDGDEADITHMSRIERAVSNFEMLVRAHGSP